MVPDASLVPRFTGVGSFFRLPIHPDPEPRAAGGRPRVGLLGIPFDAGCTFRPGARFGPEAVRRASRIVRPVSLYHDVDVFDALECLDLGDVVTNPFRIDKSVALIHARAQQALRQVDRLFSIGGDHTVSYPLLKAVHETFGRVALVHLDSHYDTWDGYCGEKLTHGTPFRRVFEEGLLDVGRSIHVGIRGTVNTVTDKADDARLGFATVFCHETDALGGVPGIVERIRARVGEGPLYISIDIDVVDPAFAPGTGTPECGGYSSAQVLAILRGLKGLVVVGGDVVEVCPAYDTADITAQLAATLCYEMLCLVA